MTRRVELKTPIQASVSRREMLRTSVGVGASVAGVLLLAACGGAAPPASTSSTASSKPSSAATSAKPAGSAAAKPAASGATAAQPAASGVSPATTARLNELFDSAKKEGEVIWGTGGKPDIYQKVVDLFQQCFPGVKMTTTGNDPNTTPDRLVTEIQSNRVSLDVTIGPLSAIQPLVDRAGLRMLDYGKAGVNSAIVGGDGQWVQFRDSVDGWIYNTSRVSAADLPKSWDDFLAPKWKGKFSLAKAGTGWERLTGVWTEDQINTFFQGLAKQNPSAAATNQAALDSVARGETFFTNVGALDSVFLRKADGAPVEMAPISPLGIKPSVMYVPKNNPHPVAAEMLVMWLATEPQVKTLKAEQEVGLAEPCAPGMKTNEWLCGKDLQLNHIDTIEKATESNRLREIILKDLGFV